MALETYGFDSFILYLIEGTTASLLIGFVGRAIGWSFNSLVRNQDHESELYGSQGD